MGWTYGSMQFLGSFCTSPKASSFSSMQDDFYMKEMVWNVAILLEEPFSDKEPWTPRLPRDSCSTFEIIPSPRELDAVQMPSREESCDLSLRTTAIITLGCYSLLWKLRGVGVGCHSQLRLILLNTCSITCSSPYDLMLLVAALRKQLGFSSSLDVFLWYQLVQGF